jgi:hypothetical protein
MKKQKFYPKQVMKKLKGRSMDGLDSGEIAALTFFYRKARKYGWAVSAINDAKSNDLLSAVSKEAADAILANSITKIFLKVA